MLETLIGSNNKFCILNTNGESTIVNEGAGHWLNNVWYSNNSYQYCNSFKYQTCQYYEQMNKRVKKATKRYIETLSYEACMGLGEYPTCNPKTGILYPEYRAEYPYLDELDWELADMYQEVYMMYQSYAEYEYDEVENAQKG